MTELSDELLVAYVDGQLAHDQSLAVERVLRNDEVAARRVEEMQVAHSRLEAAFEAMLANELDTLVGVAGPVPQAEPALEPRRSWSLFHHGGAMAVIGIALAMLTAGAVAGYNLRAMPEPVALVPPEKVPFVTGSLAPRDWQDDLVIAHGLLSRDSLSVGLESQANLELLGFHLGNVVGTELQIPDLGPFGLTFKRAQLLERKDQAIVQLAYLPLKGDPVALYAQWDKGDDSAAKLTQNDDLSAAQWRQGNITYLLAGRMDPAAMEKLAGNVRTQIAERNSLASALPEPLSAAGARAMTSDPAPSEVFTGSAAPPPAPEAQPDARH